MLEIPQWTPASNSRDHGVVVYRWGRTCRPLQCPCVPRIVPSRLASEVRPNQIEGEDKHPQRLKRDADGYYQVPSVPAAAGLICINPPRHAEEPGNVHKIECEVKADEKQPEMQFSEGFATHLSDGLREPVIKRAEDCE